VSIAVVWLRCHRKNPLWRFHAEAFALRRRRVMTRTSRPSLGVFLGAVVSIAAVVATTPPLAAQEEKPAQEKPAFDWVAGPLRADLGKHAQVQVPEGYVFLGQKQAGELMQALGNPPTGQEEGVIAPTAEDQNWMLVFEFDGMGYVKDDDKASLDADAILKSIRKGTEEANKYREKHGAPALTIVGWEVAPRYNETTHLLEWCIRGESEGRPMLNYNTRVLGRRGVMSATLLVGPEELEATLPTYRELLSTFDFMSGNRYAEFQKGDRVAEIGLTALVAGGAGALALKPGLFKKFFKLIIVGGVAVVSAIGRTVKRLFGKRGEPITPTA